MHDIYKVIMNYYIITLIGMIVIDLFLSSTLIRDTAIHTLLLTINTLVLVRVTDILIKE